MKKIYLILVLGFICTIQRAEAQKTAYVDTNYILDMIPSYSAAQRQLNSMSKLYQKELEDVLLEISTMKDDLRTELPLLSSEMQVRRQDIILTKEKEYRALQKKYFGPKGDLFLKRKALVEPIQEEIFKVISELGSRGGYAIISDKAGDSKILYADPRFDLSDKVLEKLGYK